MIEDWKPIPSLPMYEASNTGHVRVAVDRPNHRWGKGKSWPGKGHVLSEHIRIMGTNPRATVRIQNGKPRRQFLVNRLVCEAWHGVPASPELHAAHKDGDSLNNCAHNLYWATAKENAADKQRHGTVARGERQGHAKLTGRQIMFVRRLIDDGWNDLDIAEVFLVSSATINSVRHGKTWGHVPAEVRAADEKAAKARKELGLQ